MTDDVHSPALKAREKWLVISPDTEESRAAYRDQRERLRICPAARALRGGRSNSNGPERSVISPPASTRNRSIFSRACSPSLIVVSRPSRTPSRDAAYFEEDIETHKRLRELSKQPSTRANNKIISHVDDICTRFIAACPFVIIASRGADGRHDLSPKGDPPGFVAILGERTLAIPDRPGNHRLDTFENLLTHPEIGLLFLIPGNGDTLRVSGKGRIVRDRHQSGGRSRN